MTSIVIGPDQADDGADPAAEAAALFAAVQSPLRRRLLGFRYRPRRDRFYALLARRWGGAADADATTLLALARRHAPDANRDELLQQVPHWMFTFTGSGTDLLARTLALVTSRAETRRRVLEEIAAAGAPDRAETVERLPFLNACLLETGRLFPPVTRTFHGAAPNGGASDAAHEAARGGRGPEYVHWFPLLQRDDALGPDVHAFRPDRWLAPEPDAAAAASNLFLRGPRACPGADLILFVCRAALARQIGELGVAARSERLARDPLPVAFPGREARFTPSEALR
jgi:cytochrome P450